MPPRQIARLHRGLDTQTFKYKDKGIMATIGRGDAVLQMPIGLKLTGIPAWLGWIVLHIAYLLGGRNRVQTLVNLGSRYMGPRRSSAIVGDVLQTPKLRRHQEQGTGSGRRSFPKCWQIASSFDRTVQVASSFWGISPAVGVARAGIEPATFHFSGERYYRLSYLASGPGEMDPSPLYATPTGLEPATSAVTGRRANQLRHGALWPRVRTLPGARETIAQHSGSGGKADGFAGLSMDGLAGSSLTLWLLC